MTDASPRVSVIVPAHNAAAELARAVDSALAQTLSAIEVIVVDDASSDATAACATAIADRDRRVRLLRTPRNLGPAGARNLGLAVARGTWIALLDSDDAFAPERLERLLRLGQDGADMVADNLRLVDEGAGDAGAPMLDPSLLDRPRRLDAAGFLIGNLPVRGHPRVSFGFLKPMFRRAFLRDHGLRYDERLRFAEDFDFYLRCLVAGARLWLTPEAGYLYSVRAGSLTANHAARDLRRLRVVDRRLLRRPDVGADPRLRRALRRHARSVDRRLLWRLFTDALKRRDWRRATRTAAASPYTAAVVASELVQASPKLTRMALRRIGLSPSV